MNIELIVYAVMLFVGHLLSLYGATYKKQKFSTPGGILIGFVIGKLISLAVK